MATHYCIGNPCWLCHPEHAPKPEEKNYEFWMETTEDHLLHEDKISGKLRHVLLEVFDCGLDEDAHWRAMGNLTLEDMKAERAKIQDGSLEAELLDLMIKDFDRQSNGH